MSPFENFIVNVCKAQTWSSELCTYIETPKEDILRAVKREVGNKLWLEMESVYNTYGAPSPEFSAVVAKVYEKKNETDPEV